MTRTVLIKGGLGISLALGLFVFLEVHGAGEGAKKHPSAPISGATSAPVSKASPLATPTTLPSGLPSSQPALIQPSLMPSGQPSEQPSAAPSVEPSPSPSVQPPLTRDESKTLLREFNRALHAEKQALLHRQKFELKDLDSSQSARKREWELRERDARREFFARTTKGAEKRAYMQDLIARRKALFQMMAEERRERVRTQDVRRKALLDDQASRQKEFMDLLKQGIRPPERLWPQPGS